MRSEDRELDAGILSECVLHIADVKSWEEIQNSDAIKLSHIYIKAMPEDMDGRTFFHESKMPLCFYAKATKLHW